MALAYINEAFMLLSAFCVLAGWILIKRHRVRTHRRLMLLGSASALAFFLSYVLKTVLVGDTVFGGPQSLSTPYLIFLQIHTILATVAGVFGVITLRRAFKRRFARHRKIAPWTASLWFVAAGSGLMVFLLLYIIFPPGPTTNIFRAVTGG